MRIGTGLFFYGSFSPYETRWNEKNLYLHSCIIIVLRFSFFPHHPQQRFSRRGVRVAFAVFIQAFQKTGMAFPEAGRGRFGCVMGE